MSSNSDSRMLAAKVLAKVVAYDPRLRVKDHMILNAWSEQVARLRIPASHVEGCLLEAVADVYSAEQLPSNPVGAVCTQARRVWDEQRRRQERFTPVEAKPFPRPTSPQYAADVLAVSCRRCGAQSGEFCTRDGEVEMLPHIHRRVSACKLSESSG